jgi:hypothetical protein
MLVVRVLMGFGPPLVRPADNPRRPPRFDPDPGRVKARSAPLPVGLRIAGFPGG